MSDDMPMDEGNVEIVNAVNECACCDKSTAKICSDSGCKCYACVSVLIQSFSPSHHPAPLSTNTGLINQAPLDTILAIIVPPPISIL